MMNLMHSEEELSSQKCLCFCKMRRKKDIRKLPTGGSAEIFWHLILHLM